MMADKRVICVLLRGKTSNPIIQRDMQHNTPHQSQTHVHTALNTAYQSDKTFLTHTIKCLILPFSVSFNFPFRCR